MEFLPGPYLSVLLLAFLSGTTTLIDLALAIFLGDNPKLMVMGIGFSTGIMVLISLCELVQEAMKIMGPTGTSLSVGLGSALIFTLHVFIPQLHLGR